MRAAVGPNREGTKKLPETGTSLISPDSPESYLNRELSWLAFARRVLELTEDRALPLLERVKFVGIMGMLHDEFFMKRIGGLKRQVRQGVIKKSLDGRLPAEELAACRQEIRAQMLRLSGVMNGEIRPALRAAGIPIPAPQFNLIGSPLTLTGPVPLMSTSEPLMLVWAELLNSAAA